MCSKYADIFGNSIIILLGKINDDRDIDLAKNSVLCVALAGDSVNECVIGIGLFVR